jgi:hypothetical protein
MKQKITTPEILNCYCGAKAHPIDWEYKDMWKVYCDNNHTLTKECGSIHRAICLWNNRIKERNKTT